MSMLRRARLVGWRGSRAALALIAALALWLWAGVAQAQVRTVIVGVPEHSPLCFTDVDGQVRGYFIDLIENWATLNELRLRYEHGTEEELLERLRAGHIDVVPAVAPTPESSAQAAFPPY